LMPKCKCSNSN